MRKPDLQLVAKLRAQQIEAQLNALAAELKDLQVFLLTCERLSAGTTPQMLPASSPQSVALSQPVAKTAKAQILAAVVDILGSGQPRTTKDLVLELEARSVLIGGADKASNLAAMLSREKQLFRNVRGLGYSLNQQAPEKTEAAGVNAPAAPSVQL